jgi:hypothetical protein
MMMTKKKAPGRRPSTTTTSTTAPMRRLVTMLLAGLPLLATTGQGQQTTSGSFNARVLGETEGCFNSFQALLVVYFDTTQVLSNAACQRLCGDHGFIAAGTSDRACHCGNIYPPIFHRVDDRRCNAPCSLDRTSCHMSSCCGDAAGKYYTVSFAAEIEPRRELLRRLAFDYRESAPKFRQRIEGLMAQTTALQVLHSTSTSTSMASSSGSVSGSTGGSNGTASIGPATYVGLGEGCPTGWQASGDSCYMSTVGGAFPACPPACLSRNKHTKINDLDPHSPS